MTEIKVERETKKYLKATLDLAKEKGYLDAFVADMGKLKLLVESVSSEDYPEYKRLGKKFNTLSKSKQIEYISNTLDKIGVIKQVKNLAFILLQHNQLKVLRSLTHSWDRLYFNYLGFKEVKVVSALPLSKEQENKINDKLNASLGKNFYLVKEVKEEILGGLIFQVGNKIYDDSLRTKINTIKQNIRGIGYNE
jgi:F-type H+-transporting ATPase subunit delta